MEANEILSQFKQLSKEEQGQLAALIMGSMCNTYASEVVEEEFIQQMCKEHRTLQQSFTKMMLKWMEFVSSEKYRTDLRNEDSKVYVKKMVDAFTKENGYLPSQYLRMI